MPPVTNRPIRVRLEHTRYGHWGGRSGYPSFIDHLDPLRFRTERHAIGDNDDEIPPWLRPLRPWLRQALRRRPMKWYKLSDLFAELDAFRDCLMSRLDLVHFLDGEHSGQFLPRLLRLVGSEVRTVVSFHQPPELLEELLDSSLLPHFDRIVLMSPSQRRYFDGRVSNDRISVILHGVDTDFFHPAKHEREPGPLRCITVGHWLRDWQVFRSVAERMPKVEFHVVTGHETASKGISNVIRYQNIEDETLASLYRSADILFLPLLDSTANNALLEGIASGLPIITTDLQAVRAYLDGSEGILVPRGDSDASIAAIQQLQDDLGLRRRMGVLARARAEVLSWHRIAKQYEELFAELFR